MVSTGHSIIFDEERCVGCVACSQVCPTNAIRVQEGLAGLKPGLCIDCGACIPVCKYEAVKAVTSTTSDLKKFKHTVAIPSQTLYSQFGKDVHPAQILHALTEIGFDSYYDLSWMAEMVSGAVDAWLSECDAPWPKISTGCPAIIRLIQLRYPDMVDHLVPIETPRELAAKMLRTKLAAELHLDPSEIGIFFITPCTAVMNSILAPVGLSQSYLDGAFAINELYGPLLKAILRDREQEYDDRFSTTGLLAAGAGGQIAGMRNKNTLVVTGLRDITYVFNRIEAGKYQNIDFIEAWICPDGCVSGCCTMEGRYIALRTIQRIVDKLKERGTVKEEQIRGLLREHFFDLEAEIRSRAIQRAPTDLRQAIAWKQKRAAILDQLPKKDCGACGAPDCETLAEDILKGEASVEDCVFVKIARLEEAAGAREEGQT